MTNPDSIRQREREAKARETRENRQNQGDEFHETLAAPVPNRTYRSEVDLTESRASTAEQVVRFVTTLLNTLLAIRFMISLFTADRSNGLVGIFYALTDWMVRPLQILFSQTPAGTSGYFDWPALAAIAVISLIAYALLRIIRTPRV